MSRFRGIDYRGLADLSRPPSRVVHRTPRKQSNRLTPHEQEMVKLLSDGFTVKEACAWIGITWGSGKVYMNNARKRTGSRTTAQMIAKYVRATALEMAEHSFLGAGI